MNVLITGANGFLGSKLVRQLHHNGHNVFALVRKSANLDRLVDLIDKVNLIQISENIGCLVRGLDIEVIIHTATNYGRKVGANSLTELTLANELFPLSLLNDLPDDKKITFINTHSSLPALSNPYSISKANFVSWGKYLANNSKIKFVNIILEHFYGFGDDKSKFIEYLISSFTSNVDSLDFTAGEQLRDFIHVDDVVSAYIAIMNNLDIILDDFFEICVGSGDVITIRELINLIKDMVGNKKTKLNFGVIPYRNDELMCSVADITYLRNLNWTLKYRLKDGLQKYILDHKSLCQHK